MSFGENCTFPAGLRGTLSRSNWPADPAAGHSLGSSIDFVRICVPLRVRVHRGALLITRVPCGHRWSHAPPWGQPIGPICAVDEVFFKREC